MQASFDFIEYHIRTETGENHGIRAKHSRENMEDHPDGTLHVFCGMYQRAGFICFEICVSQSSDEEDSDTEGDRI